jgi:3-hydroxybutyryl-CoA dehydratase
MTEKEKSLLDKLGVKIGHKTSHSRTISEQDINTFAELSGDFNPVHVNEEYAKKTFFKGRIAHGTISIGLLSAAMAKLPGLPIFLGQDIKFLKPVRIGDTITATAEVIDMRHDKSILTLRNSCTNQNGELIIDGTATARLFPAPED